MSPEFERMRTRVPRAAEIFEAANERGDKLAQAAGICALLRTLFSQRAQSTEEFGVFDKAVIARSLLTDKPEEFERFKTMLFSHAKALVADLNEARRN